jgi:hypothetical protein
MNWSLAFGLGFTFFQSGREWVRKTATNASVIFPIGLIQSSAMLATMREISFLTSEFLCDG